MNTSSDDDDDDDLKTILGQRRKPCWTSDEAVTHCHACNQEFTWCLRKHHCRACGEIFCYRCCSNLVVLPRSIEQFPSRHFECRQPTPPLATSSQSSAAQQETTSYVKAAKSTTKFIGKTAYQYAFGKKKRNDNDHNSSNNNNNKSSSTNSSSINSSNSNGNSNVDIESASPKRERACDSCNTKLAHANKVEQYMPTLRKKTIIELAAEIKENDDEALQSAAISLLRSWREIQYALPTQQPSSLESQMLHTNWDLVAQHSCWRVMLAKSAYVEGIDKKLQTKIVDALSNNAVVTNDFHSMCNKLLCRDQICQCGWSLESCVTLLQDEAFVSEAILKSCGVFLTRSEQSTVELSLFVINLCWSLRYDNGERRAVLNSVLLHHSKLDKEFFADVFWHCMSAVHDLCLDNQIRRHYIRLLKKMREIDIAVFDQLFAGKKMLQALDASGPVQAVQDSDTCFPECVNQDLFRMPVNSAHTLSFLDLQSSKIMRSATRPMVVPCCSNETSPPFRFNVLLKREDIRMDAIIMNTIRYMRRLLETQFAPDTLKPLQQQSQVRSDATLCRERDQEDGDDRFGIVCYRCVPTSNVSGVIEIVPHSTTLDDVANKFDMKLLQFVRSRNSQTTDTETLRQRFVRSTAASSVITYLLGIGDRHLENIMLTKDGHLFHIDFGYVMGADPKKSLIGSPSMRLTNDMMEALGGLDSEQYRQFQYLCTDIFNFLRKQYTTIALLLMPLTFIGTCTVMDLEREIQMRFVPTESKSQANIQLSNTLNDSRGSVYVPSVVDLMHSGGKAASSLLTEPVMAIVSLIPKSITTLSETSTLTTKNTEKDDANGTPIPLSRNNSRANNNNKKNSNSNSNNSSGSGSGGNNNSEGGQKKTFSGRNSFDRETAALGRGVQAPLRSPLGAISPLQERLEKEEN